MNIFPGAKELVSKVNEIHEKFVETQTEFRLMRQQTTDALKEFREALIRMGSKVETMHLEDTKAHAELKAEIRGLELRLNALSERALHVVMENVAREGVRVSSLPSQIVSSSDGQE